MTIQEAIRQMAAAGSEPYCKVCTVDAVDEQTRTVDCTPIDESAPLLGVNLQAGQGGDEGVVVLPAVGSYVVAAFIDPAVAVVVLTEKIDKIMIRVDGFTAEVAGGKIRINNGTLGGVPIAGEIAAKLQTLETEVNDLKNIFHTWQVSPGDGGGALKALAETWAAQRMQLTQAAELENDKIEQ